MSFLQQSIRDQSLVEWVDLRRWNANFNDLSGQGAVGTPSDVWYGGGGVQFANDDGYISVPDVAAHRNDALSIVVVGEFDRLERPAANPGFLLTRMDGGGNIEWQFGIDDTPQLFFVDTNASATVTRAVDYRGMRSLGLTTTNGGTPIGYGQGLSLGNFSGAADVDANVDMLLYLGNNDDFDRSMLNPMHAALLFNRPLDEEEMAVLHGELMALPGGEH